MGVIVVACDGKARKVFVDVVLIRSSDGASTCTWWLSHTGDSPGNNRGNDE